MMIAAIIRQSLPMFGLKRVFEFYRSAALKEAQELFDYVGGIGLLGRSGAPLA